MGRCSRLCFGSRVGECSDGRGSEQFGRRGTRSVKEEAREVSDE